MSELDEYLSFLGWSKMDLSRRIGVHRNTISKWDNVPPLYAMAYLKQAVVLKTVVSQLNRQLEAQT